jgi:DNA repair protein RecO (recombination protein O)
MPAQASETFILRTYPLREADVVVSFFTRDQGKLRGVARRARRTKNSFGSGLERLSHVRLFFFQRENRELVSLDSCELIQSQFDLTGDWAVSVGLDFLAEVAEQLLPPHEPSERFFRLLTAVLDYLHGNGTPEGAAADRVWPAVLYFTLWAVRLSGFLPELHVKSESREIALEMMQKPIGQLSERKWSRETAADLRRQLVRAIEEHVERRLITARVLETL